MSQPPHPAITPSPIGEDEVRCLLISDFTINGLVPFLANDAETPRVAATVAPYNQVSQILLDQNAACWDAKPHVALVWTRPQSAISSFGQLANGECVNTGPMLAEVDEFVAALRCAAGRVAAVFVPTWTWPAHDRGLGLLNMDARAGLACQLMRMNLHLADATQDDSRIHLLDAARWTLLAGPVSTNPKLWYLGKIAFGPEVFRHAATDVKAGIRALKGASRKVVVLDLDDTLWGGVVGDVGWEQLRLGGHDPVGEAFSGFQRALKTLARRGVLLGIVSKNTEAIALEAIDKHPDMVLKREDFVAWRINWNDKAENLIDLAGELNVGLDSVVFIDDNPAERARVRTALPEVLVPEWPSDKLLFEKALAELTCFDSVTITDEDLARSRMYQAERQRSHVRASSQSAEEYLASLDLRVIIEPLRTANAKRAVQLLNKTNQMNLRTRRTTEAELLEFAAAPSNHVYVFRVADRFDDYGLTGIGSLSVVGEQAQVSDFVLSCRVMGRGVEDVILSVLVGCGQSLGLRELVATYLATSRNGPCRSFFDERSGLESSGADGSYIWDLRRPYSPPLHIAIHNPTAESTEPLPSLAAPA